MLNSPEQQRYTNIYVLSAETGLLYVKKKNTVILLSKVQGQTKDYKRQG